MNFSHMRIARPVSDLEHACEMYSQGLGLERIADFADHDGFSGIMLGHATLHWHLEFTTCHRHPVQPGPTDEDLLVLYYPDKPDWEQACARMAAAGFCAVPAFNPYWDMNGKTFVDEDGYRVVLQNRGWA